MFMVLVGVFPGCCLFWFLNNAESNCDFSPFDLAALVMFSFAVMTMGALLGFLIGIVSTALNIQNSNCYEKLPRPLDYLSSSLDGHTTVGTSKS